MYTKHRTIKHLNNLIQQDHRHIKQRFVKSAGFQNLCDALYKRNRGFSTYKELQKLLVNA